MFHSIIRHYFTTLALDDWGWQIEKTFSAVRAIQIIFTSVFETDGSMFRDEI